MTSSQKANITIVFFSFFCLFILYKLWTIQVVDSNRYRALAQGQQRNLHTSSKERGDVFFNGGEVLSSNIDIKNLLVIPSEIKDIEYFCSFLSDLLKIDKSEIKDKVENSYSISVIKNNITEEEEKKIRESNVLGLYIDKERKRFYPQKEMASQVIGFFGGENIGQYGIEGYYDENLNGEETISNDFLNLSSPSNKGTSLILTLDYNIQFKSEKLLEKAKNDLNIEKGSIMVMNPKTGAILAMANYPSFDPNEYYKVRDLSVFENSLIQRLYEPGSVFKAITIAGAIDQDKISPETEYNDVGYVKIGGRTLSNYSNRAYGTVNISQVLEKSINTGAVFAGQRLGSNLFLEYLEKFDFFDRTMIDLQGEVLSQNLEFKKGYEVNYATASFGHGINITPVQLVKAFSVFANEGKMVKPYIVDKIVENGKTIIVKPEFSDDKVISEETVSKVVAMLTNVIEKGFSKNAKIPGYHIAGKTGTSQIPWSVLGVNQKGYSDKTWQSFLGFFPAYNPQFLIFIKLDSPESNTAEYSAMPIFKELTEYIINYFQIPPDYEI